MKSRIQCYFIEGAAVILFFTALLGFLGAASGPSVLAQSDPLFFISNRWVLVLTGLTELFVSAFLLVRRDVRSRLLVLAWLSACLLNYRAILWSCGLADLVDCLGNLYDWLPLPPRLVGVVMNVITAGLCAGSYGFLLQNWLAGRNFKKSLPVRVAAAR